MPHKNLRQGRTSRTPAMAIGLTDHVWSYREYVWLPVHVDPVLTKQMDERITRLLTPALQDNFLAGHKHLRKQRLGQRTKKRQPLCQKLREGPVIVLQDYPIRMPSVLKSSTSNRDYQDLWRRPAHPVLS
jgi:hypothetical protein